MKTAISIPDELFEQAEKIAQRARKSRSQVFAEALREYVARHDPEVVAETLDRVLQGIERDEGEFVSEAARRILERTDWS